MDSAGVVNVENLSRIADGIKLHMAMNHFGNVHWSLDCFRYCVKRRTSNARVVTLSSLSYRMGEIRFDDLDWIDRE